MAETVNISQIANDVSNDIFEVFKWGKSKFSDENFDCEKKEHGKKTHPTDCVFHYFDPYRNKRIHLNVDLKSYGSKTIQKNEVKKAFKSLAISVACANLSEKWQEMHVVSDAEDYEIEGMLFVFNHDNKYQGDFGSYLADIDDEDQALFSGSRVHVMGPEVITRMYNVSNDILRESQELKNGYTFFYPDLILARSHGDHWNLPATLEVLNSPWIIVKYRCDESLSGAGYFVYYNRKGEEIEEFVYLLDALSHYQMLLDGSKITVKLVGADSGAFHRFESAKTKYLMDWGEDEARKKCLDEIALKSVKAVLPNYYPTEIGMSRNV